MLLILDTGNSTEILFMTTPRNDNLLYTCKNLINWKDQDEHKIILLLDSPIIEFVRPLIDS
jgi:hypothetical protein